jgi:cell division protein FtsI (penicillin-binding protein 3)
MTATKRDRMLVRRRQVLLGVWLLGNGVVVLRAADVQIRQADTWREAAGAQHQKTIQIAAPRGRILDRNGVPLAESREVVRVAIAPNELQDRARAIELLTSALRLSSAEAKRRTDPADPWNVIPGTYDPSVLETLDGVRGIHLETTHKRFYPRGDLARGVLGAVIDGKGQGGIEEVYEEVLRGTAGRQVAPRDNAGREIPGQTVVLNAPVAGGDVRLTLDMDLQEIAQEALAAALETTQARGGDLIVTSPRTGEILALVSAGGGRLDGLSAINAPYEPGSTIKPFTVAAILENGVGALDDMVDTGTGEWVINGRRVSDTSAHGVVTLAEALRVSSNVGIGKAAIALEPGDQYQALRDFGFGMQAGIPLPGEVPGRLPRPENWSGQSQVSLSIGYEIAVTPLQMAMGYGALANDGILMEPRLVSEVRDTDGSVIELAAPRQVRSAVPAEVAREVGRVLVEVVEDGTGTAAQVDAFQVAGKTGTARAYTAGAGYSGGRYFSSFAAFFPADDPQLVVFVKLDSPKGAYYGGATAAPVSRAMMEAALATWTTPLDRGALLESSRRTRRVAESRADPGPTASSPVRFASANLGVPAAAAEPSPELEALALLAGDPRDEEPVVERRADGSLPVPDVEGLSPRVAVRRLHAAGLRVVWDGGGQVVGTTPSAGSRAQPGDTIRLQTRSLARP